MKPKIEMNIDLGFILKILIIGILLYFIISAFTSESTINIESHECKTIDCEVWLWGLMASCISHINEKCLEMKYLDFENQLEEQ